MTNSVKNALVAAGFTAALSTAALLGSAVASAEPNGQADPSGVQCSHAGITISCPVGAIADTDGTQGDFRSAIQGNVDGDGTQGEIRTGGQGVADDDGFQGAYAYGSTFAYPQYR